MRRRSIDQKQNKKMGLRPLQLPNADRQYRQQTFFCFLKHSTSIGPSYDQVFFLQLISDPIATPMAYRKVAFPEEKHIFTESGGSTTQDKFDGKKDCQMEKQYCQDTGFSWAFPLQ